MSGGEFQVVRTSYNLKYCIMKRYVLSHTLKVVLSTLSLTHVLCAFLQAIYILDVLSIEHIYPRFSHVSKCFLLLDRVRGEDPTL